MNSTTMAPAAMTLERPALDVRIVHLRRKMLNLSIEHCSERTIAIPGFWAKLEAGEVTEIDRQTVLDIADTLTSSHTRKNTTRFHPLRSCTIAADRPASARRRWRSRFEGIARQGLCHQSRVEIRGAGEEGDKPNPEDCWLEDWANQADQQGTRAREKLRDGVETSIKSLGAGFLTTRGNEALRARLSSGELSTQDFYRQLLRLVYRLLMLLVAEEKRSESGDNLLHPPGTPFEVRDRYARYYSVGRVRSLAYERRGTAHTDLYDSLKVLFLKLRTGYEPLGIPGMGSFLFSDDSTPDLDDAFNRTEVPRHRTTACKRQPCCSRKN
ncbi:hypothetical protein N9N28_18290 [Rubripirellula amarantea]|nr:hypothetical protein [Rubripirellula amarantea]